MKGRLKLEGQNGPVPWHFRHKLSNSVAPHLNITENTSDNALNELFVNCDSDLYDIDDNSNVTGNLPVQEGAAVRYTDSEGSDILQHTSVSQLVANVCLLIL